MSKRGRVLVVDDEPDIVEFISDVLEGEGYTVYSAVGEAALHKAQELHPDLILLDIMMPGMNGVEVSQHLQEDTRTADIPIIALSAGHNLRAHAAEMAAVDYLAKPFDLSELLLRVEKWIGRQPAFLHSKH